MATRSNVRLVNSETKSVEMSSYCHWDGYPENMMPTLSWGYTTVEDVKELLLLGDISSLEYDVKSTTFYCRDRGEELKNSGNIRYFEEGQKVEDEDLWNIEHIYDFDVVTKKWVHHEVAY